MREERNMVFNWYTGMGRVKPGWADDPVKRQAGRGWPGGRTLDDRRGGG